MDILRIYKIFLLKHSESIANYHMEKIIMTIPYTEVASIYYWYKIKFEQKFSEEVEVAEKFY